MGSGALFLVVLTIAAVTLLVMQIAKPSNDYQGRTITVSATGDAFQTPDVAEFTYTVRKEGKDVSTTQTEVTKQSNAVLESLKEIGVKEEDIQTQNISANPRYEWQNRAVTCPVGNYCPPEGRNVLVGYESSITVAVRTRDFDLASKILSTLGAANVSDIQGPQFTTEDPDQAQNEAREEALVRAREKAKSMASAMGVRLGRVVSFSEGGDVYPMYARAESAAYDMAGNMTKSVAAPVPVIAAGQDKISVSVNVVYRIR